MYDNEYEWDILLFLRILKYLHTSDADMVNAIIRDYPEVDVEDPDMIMYDLLWAFFDEEPEETDDEFYTVRFSDQSIDRLYQLGCQDGDIFSSKFRMWQEKIKDIFCFMSLAHPTLSSMLPIILPETASRSTLHFHRIAMSRFSS